MKRMYAMLLVLLLLFAAGVASAYEQETKEQRKQAIRAEKKARKEEKKQQQQEIRNYQYLRNQAVVDFAKQHQPAAVMNPFNTDFSISNIICAGEEATGIVMLHFEITSSRIYDYRLLIGGSHNGTEAVTDREDYPASSHYGFLYRINTNMPEQIVVTFYNVNRSISSFDHIDVSIGIGQSLMNRITLVNVPICWTASDRTIRDYVRSGVSEKNQNN